jgi:hypothetical protein
LAEADTPTELDEVGREKVVDELDPAADEHLLKHAADERFVVCGRHANTSREYLWSV